MTDLRIRIIVSGLVCFAVVSGFYHLFERQSGPPAGVWSMSGGTHDGESWTARLVLWESNQQQLTGVVTWSDSLGQTRSDGLRALCDVSKREITVISTHRPLPQGLKGDQFTGYLVQRGPVLDGGIWATAGADKETESEAFWTVNMR